jgi:hypothetical protein
MIIRLPRYALVAGCSHCTSTPDLLTTHATHANFRADDQTKSTSRPIGQPQVKRARAALPPPRTHHPTKASVGVATKSPLLKGPKEKPGYDTVVVIPGSQNLVFGRASDITPVSIRNVIAWRVSGRKPTANTHGDRVAHPEREAGCAVALDMIDKEIRRGGGVRARGTDTPLRTAVPLEQVKAFNSKVVPELFTDECSFQRRYQYIDTSDAPPFLVGNDALRV